MIKTPSILFATLFVVSMLTACVNVDAYPDSWRNIEPVKANGRCPDVSGRYVETGTTSKLGCHPHQEKCVRLSYDLLSGDTGYSEVWDKSLTPDFSAGTTSVELMQQGDQSIEVVLWTSGATDGTFVARGRVIRRDRLNLDDGDYSCGAEGLTLRTRYIYFLFGISNLVGFEDRSFNRAEDGALVMKSEETIIAHHTFVPFGGSRTVWVRWPAAEEAGW